MSLYSDIEISEHYSLHFHFWKIDCSLFNADDIIDYWKLLRLAFHGSVVLLNIAAINFIDILVKFCNTIKTDKVKELIG